MSVKLTTEDFIRKAHRVHGYRYDYSKVNYLNTKTKVQIICKTHGIFEQTPNGHLLGKNCPKCVGGVKLTTEEFINKAYSIHKDRYDYSKVVYINNHTKVQIVCSIHGIFEQTPNGHLLGNNCPKCVGGISMDTKDFISKAKDIHNNKYDYTNVVYKNSHTKVQIVCKTHGVFEQRPHGHLAGRGCKYCGGSAKKSLDIFKKDANSIHSSKYDYSLVTSNMYYEKIPIVCKEHGTFYQQVGSHLAGNGCPNCAVYGFNVNKPAIVYYLQVQHDNILYYKIGITNRDIDNRYSVSDKIKILNKVVHICKLGSIARRIEKRIIDKYSKYLYKGNEIILESARGNTELFTVDILKLFNGGKMT